MGAARPVGDRIAGALLVLATVLGLVLGLSGPATSPVAPGAPPVAVLSGLANRVSGISPADDGNAPRGPR